MSVNPPPTLAQEKPAESGPERRHAGKKKRPSREAARPNVTAAEPQ
jgi:hypothetical protein